MKNLYVFPALLLAISFLACSHKHNHNDDHDHDHDHDEVLTITSYNDNFEVFMEATPFVIKEESSITAYISHLPDFKPLTDGNVVITMSVSSDQIETVSAEHVRDGIYNLNITPDKAGNAVLSFNIISDNDSSTVTFDNIIIFEDEHEAHEAAHIAHPQISNSISFNKTQSWKVGFATEVVKCSDFGQIIKTTAQVQPSSGDERIITAKTDGLVIFQDNKTVPGRNVSTNQRLFYIDASEMAENNLSVRFLEAESEYERAKTEFERKEKLAVDDIVSQSELLQAKTELTSAKANIDNLRRNFTEGKQAVSSPISGYINEVMVKNGEYVSAGQAVLRVSQNKNLFIKADVQPKYYNELASISTATIRIPSKDIVYTLDDLNGKVLSYSKSSDMNNPLIPVMFQISNNADLIPGSFVDMYIKIKTDSEQLTVPNSAIVEEMGAFFVMVQITPELFEKRSIIKGSTDGINTQILSGISENERIVSKGAIFVKLAQAAGALDPHAGHMH